MKPEKPPTHKAHDILRSARPLGVFFQPESVAVIGATEKAGSVGRTILWNLISSPFGGTVYPVNPGRPNVLGIKAYPDIAAVPETVDLVVVVTPAPTVPEVIAQCVAAGVEAAIVISAGFKETGEAGAELERQIPEQARCGRMRIIGPNCLGVMYPPSGLNATFAARMARTGNVAFISQSGALCTAVLDWSLRENVGFSAFVSVGSMVDVGWGDLIDYFGNDRNTQSIVIYMETVGNARAFLSAAREVALSKPIIVIKPGRTEAAARAAASHTGSLTGSDEALDAAFRRCGVLRVNTIADVFYMSEVLAKQPRPRGPRLTVVTNAGGPGVLATDALLSEGGELAELGPKTRAALNEILPPAWSHSNPIDILGDAPPERYAATLRVAAKDPETDGLLVILTPQAMTDPTQTADHLKPFAKSLGKPILASWMGGTDVAAGESILNQAEIPTFPYPDTAARMFAYMWRYSYSLRGIYETPVLASAANPNRSGRPRAQRIIQDARSAGRTLLTEFESKEILAAYDIPTVETRLATTEAEAVKVAGEIGYPVAMKLHSETITHKTDVGGVILNLGNPDDVGHAFVTIRDSVSQAAGPAHFLGVTVQPMVNLGGYELILGSSVDDQLGPVLLFGAGGQLVEVFKDRALGLPPLNTTLARRLMERTRVLAALKGVRGRPPVDLAGLEQLLIRFSELVVEQRWIREIDINPLLASSERLLSLDARVVLHGPEVKEESLPGVAIRPYPAQYVTSATLRDGTAVTIRPIRPEDEPLIVQFHQTLSAASVYFRYFHMMALSQRVAHERLTRICFIDYDREIALVAEHAGPATSERAVLGIGRLSRLTGTKNAEFAVLISDQYQRQGLGTELVRQLIHIGRQEGLRKICAEIMLENTVMRKVCKKLDFELHPVPDDGLVLAELDLGGCAPASPS